MELHVFRLFVTCYLTCVLCKNAVGESTNVKIFPSINNAFQLGARISEIDNTRIEQSTETETRLDGISLKNDSPETSREFPLVQDLSMKTKILNDFKEVECSRFVINLRNNKYLCKNNNIKNNGKYINRIFIIFIMFQLLAGIFFTYKCMQKRTILKK